MESWYDKPEDIVEYTPSAAVANGDLVMLPNGQAGQALQDIAAGKPGSFRVSGIIELPKPANIALLAGGDAYLDVSAAPKVATYFAETGTPDYYIGTFEADAAAADAYARVRLNGRTRYLVDIERPGEGDGWTAAKTGSGTGSSIPQYTPTAGTAGAPKAGVHSLSVEATNEAQSARIKSNRGWLGATPGITELRVNVVAASNNTVDVNFGIADDYHASDFDSVTHQATFHLDGGDTSVFTESDDNTTDRAAADSTQDVTLGTIDEYWIDHRDLTNVLYYRNGVVIDTSAAKRTLAGSAAAVLRIVAEIEKSAGTATGEVQFTRARMRPVIE